MRYTCALMAIVPLVKCHFVFMRIAVNSVWHEPTQYIRNRTEGPYDELDTPGANFDYRYYHWPTYPSTDRAESIRCGRDTMVHATDTDTLTVKAGDTIEFAHMRYAPSKWTPEFWTDCPDGLGTCQPMYPEDPYVDINHSGPFTAHISRVPDDMNISQYDGSGPWVKIWTLGLKWQKEGDTHVFWLPWNATVAGYQGRPNPFRFTIPRQTPAGQYLLRPDLTFPGLFGQSPSDAQTYPACAHINVENDGAAIDLPKGIQIPEDFDKGEAPGFLVSWEMSASQVIDPEYVYPGGPLWNGETYVQDKPTIP